MANPASARACSFLSKVPYHVQHARQSSLAHAYVPIRHSAIAVTLGIVSCSVDEPLGATLGLSADGSIQLLMPALILPMPVQPYSCFSAYGTFRYRSELCQLSYPHLRCTA